MNKRLIWKIATYVLIALLILFVLYGPMC